MNKIVKLLTAVIMIAALGTLGSCKKSFDNPPGPSDPNIVANTSIRALKAMHTTPGALDLITTDIIISGIVVADDKSGNLYKQIYIQDETGGIQVLLEATGLFGTYPVGRRVFIRCNGLCISDYNNTMELGVKAYINGVPSVETIPGALINQYLIGGSLNNPVTPITVTLSQLSTAPGMQSPYIGALIQLDDYEFADTTVTYSDTSAYKNTTNLNIKNCAGQTIILRTSGYADFAGQRVAAGHGSIAAIYTVFGTTRQLILRDPSDVKFNDGRCNLFEESFGSLTTADNNLEFTFSGWKNIAPNATAKYKNTVFGTSGRAVKVTAFGTSLSLDTAWLITPAIALPAGTSPQFAFSTSYQFAVGPTSLHAFISTNYNGGPDPNTATWTQLTTNANVPGNTATNNVATFSTLTGSGNIPLAAYAGQTVYIAFKYTGGTSPARTTNFEIDDIRVVRQ